MPTTRRLTMGQAIVEFLTAAAHESRRRGTAVLRRRVDDLRPRQRGRHRPGAPPGEGPAARCYLPRNEQAMVHTAVGFAKMANRRRTIACTSSIGPGATNMITGAALATINRLPVLLLPGDIFATRGPAPVLQQLESPALAGRVGQRLLPAGLEILGSHQPARAADHRAARGAARPDVAGGDRRGHALPAAGRADRGVRLSRGAVPQARLDHRAAASRRGAVARRRPTWLRAAQAPLIVAGGGAIYSEATDALARFAAGHRHPGRRDDGRQGRAALRSSAGARRDRRHRRGRREPDRARGRSRHRASARG